MNGNAYPPPDRPPDRGSDLRVRGTPLALALLLAGAIIAGATGTALAYYATHIGGSETVVVREYSVELTPTTEGTYQVLLPVPEDGQGRNPPGFGLRVVEGQPRFHLATTERGVALSVAAEGPVKLRGEGAYPLRLGLEDPRATYKQFRFYTFLAPGAEGPVLLKLELRERSHVEDWEQHVDLGKALVVQEPLEPRGWQVLPATQLFDIAAGAGYRAEWPQLALGAAVASVGALYAPAGLIALGAVRARRRP